MTNKPYAAQKARPLAAKTVSISQRFLRKEQEVVERQIRIYDDMIRNMDLLEHFGLHVTLMMMELHTDILIELQHENDGEKTVEELKSIIIERLLNPDYLYETMREEMYFSNAGYLQEHQEFMLEILEDCLDHPLYPAYKKAMRHYVVQVLPTPILVSVV